MNRWFETGASSGGNTRARASFEVVYYVDVPLDYVLIEKIESKVMIWNLTFM